MATTQSVAAGLPLSWEVHDVWTEAYVGVRHLIYEILPAPSRKLSIEHQAMCQLALVGANHLMEVGLYRFLESRPEYKTMSGTEKTKLRKASYADMLNIWVLKLAGWQPALDAQPYQCTERLRRRRNDTVHKTSAKANVPMCRSAFFSAVTGTHELWAKSAEPFPYEGFLAKYMLPEEKPFSLATFTR